MEKIKSRSKLKKNKNSWMMHCHVKGGVSKVQDSECTQWCGDCKSPHYCWTRPSVTLRL